MPCIFRHIDRPVENSVTLNLFISMSGAAYGEVTGPILHDADGVDLDIVERCLPAVPEDAYYAAIRMANRNDCEIVVTGDRSLWQADWGYLVGEHDTEKVRYFVSEARRGLARAS